METGGHQLFALGARLEACAGFVRTGKVPADIGTDHAYLPIWLVQTGRVPEAYASDINEEPVRSANRHIASHGLSDQIKTFTADGLDSIPSDRVDDIIIAGMGGDNIAAILGGADWLQNPRYRLILQPMSKAAKLREHLFSSGFDIVAEKAVCEAGRIYTVICAGFTGNPLTYDDYDIYAGRLDGSDPNAAALLRKQAGILRSVAEGCGAKGDAAGQAHYTALAERLTENAKGGKNIAEHTGNI